MVVGRGQGEPSGGDRIRSVRGRQVLDSRGNPTVEVDVVLESGAFGRGAVPSGASTGAHEALELRDGDPGSFGGMGVTKAVRNVNQRLAPELVGMSCLRQHEIDRLMIEMDGTPNKQRLGANAILGVSMAAARAAAAHLRVPLYRHLRADARYALPLPMMNIVNGGKHAGNGLAVQEFLVEPVSASGYSEALRMGDEVYHSLKGVLREKYGASATNVGDEGGYAPPLSRTEEALDAVVLAVKRAGYQESDVALGIDAAASGFFDGEAYSIDGGRLSPRQLEDYYVKLIDSYPIKTVEDPFHEDSYEDFAAMTRRVGSRVKIIGDDIYVTNHARIKKGVDERTTNAVLIKLNQVGTVTETLHAVRTAVEGRWMVVVSHRSGETEDTFISHLATAVGSTFIKTGAPARGERVAKYNELLRMEEELGAALSRPSFD
ncbi:MAG: phosphopyruvate hydratase [Nitrososphaerota archaeon]|nr:phosphopyruvate hydratase [Nitrososphaerota archaeon]MDG6939154.1 phosphopyruvate hydratase [Nitrososphaerota archaeon]